MCLAINKDKDSNVPFNKTNIRWKVVSTAGKEFFAPYRNNKYNRLGWNYATFLNSSFSPRYDGFHVFVSSQAAHIEKITHGGAVVKKIEVRGFLSAGYFNGKPSETWAAFRFID